MQQQLSHWFASENGVFVRQQETQLLQKLWSELSGSEGAQMGGVGCDAYVDGCSVSRMVNLDDVACEGEQVFDQLTQKGIQPNTLSLIVLPHTLDLPVDIDAWFAVVEQLLTPEGHLIVLGFNPGGRWRMKRWFGRHATSLANMRKLAPGKLVTKLAGMGLECLGCEYSVTSPLSRYGTKKIMQSMPGVFGLVYALHMIKRQSGGTPVGPSTWFRRRFTLTSESPVQTRQTIE